MGQLINEAANFNYFSSSFLILVSRFCAARQDKKPGLVFAEGLE